MKNRFIYNFIAVIAVVLFLSSENAFAADKNANVSLPSFKVTLNGSEINNSYSQYPLIVYKDITYFPMTFGGCRYLGLETKWDQEAGLEINKTNISYPFEEYKTNQKNSTEYTALIPEFNIKINGKTVDKSNAEYPLLSFRDITYFPLTWEYGVNEFGWDYHFDNNNGLVIKSQNASPEMLELVDHLHEEDRCGGFIVQGDYIYYTGNNGTIYRAPLNDLKNNRKIYQLPKDTYFGEDEDIYVKPYFNHRDGKVIFSYSASGTKGMTYEIAIKADGTTMEPVAIGPFIAPEVSEEGFLMYKSKSSYETDNYLYMITSNINVDNDPHKIYKLNKETGKITLVNKKPAEAFKYRNERLYFVSDDSMLYSLFLDDETIRLESSGPVYRENYEVLGNDIYYINDKDQKVYKEGDTNSLNLGETGETIKMTGDYIVLNFNTTLDKSYRSIVYDKNGNVAFILPRIMSEVSADSNIMTYFDEFDKKVFLVEMR
ncbi:MULTISPECIES: hypothetical protein [unclassified Sedimentibacter]|uniref:hypothetical protein n=1 Tax=unclassified Sedimentibacter TaxID=2649220 RepID=UPI0027E1D8A6|nr:hypothetical protein [Sedimentibacter sp. MB35-C1]WMJ77480.1 hypothetical protein RBQ61_00695 [Sedimentibacter sp. MB35-C1]